MKNKHIKIIVVAMSLLGFGVAFASDDSVSAYSVIGNDTTDPAKTYIDEHGDGITSINIAADCSELSEVFDAIGNYQTNIYLTSDCSENIVIGSGKKVNLIANYYDSDGQYYGSLETMNTAIPNSEKYVPRSGSKVSHRIVGQDGVSLTVQEGATVIVDGLVMNVSDLAIANHGTLLLMGGAWGQVYNTGALYLGGGSYTDAEFRNIIGSTFRIVDGFFGDRKEFVEANAANHVIVSGDDDNYNVTATMPVTPAHLFDSVSLPVVVDVDAPYTIDGGQYGEIAEALLMTARSSDTSVLSTSGSPISNITLSGVSSGIVGLHFKNTHPAFQFARSFRYQEIMSYKLPNTISAARRIWINKVLNDQFGDPEYGMIPEGPLKAALATTGAIDITLNQYELAAADVAASDIEKIMALIDEGESTVVQYYDLSVSVRNADTAEILVNLSELGDGNGEIVTFAVPESVKNVPSGTTREFQIYHVHNGVAEKIASVTDENGVHFIADKFSVYALGYKDTRSKTPVDNATGDEAKAPNTGAANSVSGGARTALSVALPIAAFIVVAALASRGYRHKVHFDKH